MLEWDINQMGKYSNGKIFKLWINKKKINVNCESMKKISILMDMAMMHIITIVNGKYKNWGPIKKNINF